MQKEFILESAGKIIQKNGVQHLFMDEVAKQSGVSKKTIYSLFENKEALLMSLVHTFVENQKDAFYQNLAKEASEVDKIMFIISCYYDFMSYIPYYNFIFLEKRYPEVYQELNKFLAEISENLKSNLQLAQQKSLVYEDIDVEKIMDMLYLNLKYIHQNYLRFQAENSLETWRYQILQIFKRSILIQFRSK